MDEKGVEIEKEGKEYMVKIEIYMKKKMEIKNKIG